MAHKQPSRVLMEHAVAAECLHVPLLTYLMNHLNKQPHEITSIYHSQIEVILCRQIAS